MQSKIKLLLLFSLFSLSLTACSSSSKKEVPAQTVMPVSQNAGREDIQEKLGKASDTENNKKSGISSDSYENITFAGYDGKISFYYDKSGSVMYYKWSTNEPDSQKASATYEDVCAALSQSYGRGMENNSPNSNLYTTSWNNEKQQITAQKAYDGNGYEISYMVVG